MTTSSVSTSSTAEKITAQTTQSHQKYKIGWWGKPSSSLTLGTFTLVADYSALPKFTPIRSMLYVGNIFFSGTSPWQFTTWVKHHGARRLGACADCEVFARISMVVLSTIQRHCCFWRSRRPQKQQQWRQRQRRSSSSRCDFTTPTCQTNQRRRIKLTPVRSALPGGANKLKVLSTLRAIAGVLLWLWNAV